MIKTLYKIPAPDSLGAQIEVYGEPENAWYEWRVIDGDGHILRDTGTEGQIPKVLASVLSIFIQRTKRKNVSTIYGRVNNALGAIPLSGK